MREVRHKKRGVVGLVLKEGNNFVCVKFPDRRKAVWVSQKAVEPVKRVTASMISELGHEEAE